MALLLALSCLVAPSSAVDGMVRRHGATSVAVDGHGAVPSLVVPNEIIQGDKKVFTSDFALHIKQDAKSSVGDLVNFTSWQKLSVDDGKMNEDGVVTEDGNPISSCEDRVATPPTGRACADDAECSPTAGCNGLLTQEECDKHFSRSINGFPYKCAWYKDVLRPPDL